VHIIAENQKKRKKNPQGSGKITLEKGRNGGDVSRGKKRAKGLKKVSE